MKLSNEICFGALVRIRPDLCRHYRKPGASESGVVMWLSPTGAIARVRMDQVADSYVRVDDLEGVHMSSVVRSPFRPDRVAA
jgi:hypothetical protein